MSLNKRERMKGFKMSEFSRKIQFPYIPLLTYKHSVMADDQKILTKKERKELMDNRSGTMSEEDYWDEVDRQEDNLKED